VGADDGNPAPEHAQGLGLSAKRARKAHQILSQILASAVGGGRLPRNVPEGIKLPKVQRREMYFLTAAQEVAGHLEWAGSRPTGPERFGCRARWLRSWTPTWPVG
jgi:hypothetical protein